MDECLTIRLFFWGNDIALPRLWPFHDLLAARDDIDFHLHLVGRYGGPAGDVAGREYVTHGWRLPPRGRSEVWIIRGWNRPQLLWRSLTASGGRVPIVMWGESPGRTFEAGTLVQAVRIAARERLLPQLLRPYGERSLLLGIGAQAVEAFSTLAPASQVREFPYPNPVADDLLSATANRAHDREQRGAGEVVRLLFVGRFEYLKAVDLISQACERLWQDGEHFHLRYVGNGALRPMLEEQAARYPEQVEIFPFASGPTLTSHFMESSALLLPSRRDGWGLPIHEGLAAGIPVLASDACGARELVSANNCGAVVKSNDVAALTAGMRATLEIVRRRDSELSRRARAIAATMTMPRLADTLVEHCHTAERLAHRELAAT